MQERARILGGSLRAGPMRGGGYEVLGRLPLSPQPVEPPLLTANPA